MRREFVLGSVLAAAMTVGLAAQAGGSGSQGTATKRGRAQTDKSAQTVTLTGCVQTAPQGMGSTGKNTQYMLTDVSSTAGTSGTGSPPASGGTAATGAPTSGNVMLVGSSLKSHVGHRVEVRGKMDSSATTMGTAGAGTGTGAAGTTGAGTPAGTAAATSGKLHVTSVKMLAATCSGAL